MIALFSNLSKAMASQSFAVCNSTFSEMLPEPIKTPDIYIETSTIEREDGTTFVVIHTVVKLNGQTISDTLEIDIIKTR